MGKRSWNFLTGICAQLTVRYGETTVSIIMLLGGGSSDDVRMDLYLCYNTPRKQLRLLSSIHPPAGSLWRHVLPAQQPYDLSSKERVSRPARRAGSVVRWPPGEESARPPRWRGIVKKRKSQHDTGIKSARTRERPGVRVHCCIAVVALRGWVGRLVREGWWFGRCVVDGRAGSWLSVCGLRVLQFRFLDPWCFHHHYYSFDDRPPRSNCSFTSTAVRHCCARVLL